MKLDELYEKWYEIRKKYDVLILSQLIKLYEERYKIRKRKVSVDYIYNELHDEPIYILYERNFIISEALKLKNEQNL